MQKKILASLLVTPLAFNAFADIVLDDLKAPEAWVPAGLIGNGFEINGTLISAAVGAGEVSQTVTLPQGSYKVNIGTLTNATVAVSGAVETPVDATKNTEVTFTCTGGEVTVTIAPENAASSFAFGDVQLTLEFGNTALKTALEAQLVSLTNVDDSEEFASEVEALRARQEALQETLDALTEKVANLEDGKFTLALYEEYKLYDEEAADGLIAQVAAYKEAADAYNKDAAAENAKINAVATNTAAEAALLEGVETLKASLKEISDKLDAEDAPQAEGVEDYLGTACDATVKDITAAIAAYEAAIKEAYADKTKVDIEFAPEVNAETLAEDIEGLKAKYDGAVADIAAYNTFVTEVLRGLDKAYSEASNSLMGVKGYNEENVDIFNGRIQEWQSTIAKTYADAQADMKIKEGTVEGAADLLSGDQATADTAKTEMADFAKAQVELVAAQNELMTETAKSLAEAQTTIDSLSKIDEITEDVAAQQNLLTTLVDKVNEAYAALGLPVTDFEDELGAITTALTDLQAAVQPILDIQKKFDEAKAEIEEQIKGTAIEGKFNDTFKAIQDAIDALTTDNNDTTEISSAIDNAKTNATNLIEAFKAADKAVADMETAVEDIDKLIADKTILKGADFDKAAYKADKEGAYAKFVAQLGEFNDALDKAAAAPGQQCYDQATALKAAIDAYGVAAQVTAVEKDFETKATEANQKLVADLLDEVKDAANNNEIGTITGVEADMFDEIDTTMAGIDADLTAAKDAADFSADAFTAVDTKLEAALETVKGLQTTVNDMVENQTIFNGFDKRMTDLEKAIKAAYAFSQDNAIDPAKGFFANTIGDLDATPAEGSYAAQLNKLQTDMDTALEGQKMADEQKSFEKTLSDLETLVAGVETWVKNNETAHNLQLGYSQTVRSYIEGVIAAIEKRNTDAKNDASFIAEWIDGLNGLLANDLTSLDRTVYESFGKGESAQKDETYKQAYDDIKKKAEAIDTDATDNFAKEVAATNNALVNSDSAWQNVLDGLNDTYKAAVQKYNLFMYGLTNKDYKDYVHDTVADHEAIYTYSSEISDLAQAVQTYVDEQNDAEHVISETEFKTEALDKAAALTAEMNGIVNTMLEALKTKAADYYTQLSSEAQTAITTAETDMQDAGVVTDLITETLAKAKTLLEAVTKADEGQNANAVAEAEAAAAKPASGLTADAAYGYSYGKAMDAIATSLDNVLAAIDVDAAAKTQWGNTYKDTMDGVDQMIADITENGTYKNASEDVVEAQMEIINAAKEEMETLNTTPATKLENLAEKTTQLQDLYTTITDATDVIANSNDKNTAAQELLKDVQAAIETYNDEFAALQAYVNGMMVGSTVDLTAAKAAVDAVAALVENDKLVATEAVVTSTLEAAKTAVENAYGTAAGKEMAALQTLVSKVKVAFNDAKVYGDLDAKTLEEINAGINKIDAAVDSKTDDNDLIYTPETKDKFRKTAIAYETELSGYYQQLQGSWTDGEGDNKNPDPDPAATIAQALQDQYDEVSAALTEAQNKLAGCLPAVTESDEKFGEQYEALATQLEALKAGWEAAGDRLIATQGNYADGMTEIAKEIETISAAVDAAQADAQAVKDAQDASNAFADKLQEKLDGMQTDLDNLKATLAEDGVLTQYQGWVANIQTLIDTAQDDLTAAKDAFSLDENSTLTNGETIAHDILWLAVKGKYAYAVVESNNAATEISATNTVLTGNIVPDVKADLNAQLAALRLRKEVVDNKIQELSTSGADYQDDLEGWAAAFDAEAQKAKDIADEAKAIAESAAENEFVPGDVNNEPDGVVDVVDVQMIATWSGEKLSYDQIKEQYSARQAAAADLNNDAMVNIADVTAVVRLAMDAENGNEGARYAYARGIAGGNDTMDIVPLGTEDGVRRYELNLNNSTEFIAGQFDVILPAGVELLDAKLADRTSDHVIQVYQHEGSATILIFSMKNSKFSGHSGALVVLETRGAGTIDIENAVFVDARNQQYNVQKGSMSFIDTITEGARNLKESIYNVAGQARQSIQRGINIIRRSDGTTTKELHK